MMVKSTTFLLWFPADREILFTFFIKDKILFFEEGNKSSLGQTESWVPPMRRAAKVPLSKQKATGRGHRFAARAGSCRAPVPHAAVPRRARGSRSPSSHRPVPAAGGFLLACDCNQ